MWDELNVRSYQRLAKIRTTGEVRQAAASRMTFWGVIRQVRNTGKPQSYFKLIYKDGFFFVYIHVIHNWKGCNLSCKGEHLYTNSYIIYKTATKSRQVFFIYL